MLENEIAILSSMTTFERIVQLIGSCREDDRLLAVYGYCSSDLAKELSYLRDGQLDDLFVNGRLTSYAAQIANGLSVLQQHRIVHADLAIKNILIQDGAVKICDFGLSFLLPENMIGEVYIISMHSVIAWPIMPPEVLSNNEFSKKTDIWSYGLLVYEMFRGVKALPIFPSDEKLLKYLRSSKKKWKGVDEILPVFM